MKPGEMKLTGLWMKQPRGFPKESLKDIKKMYRGWISLWRKLIDSRIFQNEGLLKVWIWCLLKASRIERWIPVKTGRGETEVFLKPGQFIYGRKSAAKELKMNPETVRKRMNKLKSLENITIESTKQYSIITVLNWGSYQGNKIKSTIESTKEIPTEYQPSTTNNNIKNVKNKNRPPAVPFLSNSFDKEMKAFFESIKRSCQRIVELPAKDKPFNPFQFVQHKLNLKNHPGAINETLQALVEYWETTKEPWAYANSIIKTRNQSWNEKESIEIHNKLKSGDVPEEMKGILSGLFERI